MSDEFTITDGTPQAAQVRTTVKQYLARKGIVYSHRNGETEPPTIEGHYWFSYNRRNKTLDTIRGGLMASVYVSSAKILCIALMYSDIRYLPDELHGFWWGPIVPPWESNG